MPWSKNSNTDYREEKRLPVRFQLPTSNPSFFIPSFFKTNQQTLQSAPHPHISPESVKYPPTPARSAPRVWGPEWHTWRISPFGPQQKSCLSFALLPLPGTVDQIKIFSFVAYRNFEAVSGVLPLWLFWGFLGCWAGVWGSVRGNATIRGGEGVSARLMAWCYNFLLLFLVRLGNNFLYLFYFFITNK